VIGRLEELAERARGEGGKIMIAFYTRQISYQEALGAAARGLASLPVPS